MARLWLMAGAGLGLIAVLMGTFAAHGLDDKLEPRMMDVFQIGVRYQFYHVAALLAVGLLWFRAPTKSLGAAGGLFLLGTIVFSGSLYLLVCTGAKWLGMVAPFGGTMLIVGWFFLAVSAFKLDPDD